MDYSYLLRILYDTIKSGLLINNEEVYDFFACQNITDLGIAVGINDTVAHKEDRQEFDLTDVIKIDSWFKGTNDLWYDGAFTITLNQEYEHHLFVVKEALRFATTKAIAGAKASEISRAVESIIKTNKELTIIKNLTGHDINDKLHGGRRIYNTYKQALEDDFTLEEGMRIAIEPLVVIKGCGDWNKDTWKTIDGAKVIHFENTVLIGETATVEYGL